MGALSTEVVVTLLALISAVPPALRAMAKATAHNDLIRFEFKTEVSECHDEGCYGR